MYLAINIKCTCLHSEFENNPVHNKGCDVGWYSINVGGSQ